MKILQKIRSLSRKGKLAVAVLTLGVLGAVPFAAQAEFFPNRPTFDYNKPCNPNDADKYDRCGSLEGPVFNSFVNTPSYGDERAFLDARRSDQTASGSYKNVLPDVTKGSKEVVLRLYIHNNANQDTNASGKGIAKNTRVRIALPNTEGDALRAVGYISADNATPQIVEDTVDLTSTERFTVAYKPGSAILRNNGPFANGKALPDSVVTSGTQIGWDQLNGDFPGCFEFDAQVQVTLVVTPKENPSLDLTKQVRKTKEGQTGGWVTEVAGKPGEKVDWLLNTKNTSQAALTDVVTSDVLPPHVRLVPGSVKFINARGQQVLQDAPLFSGGYNAGRYDPNDNTLITFTTTLLGDFSECEVRVRNVAFAKSAQTPEVKDDADVVITRDDCEPPEEEKPVYSCDALQVTALGGRAYRFLVRFTAKDGATLKSYTYDFGDGSAPLNTDKNPVDYTYTKDGNFVTRVKLTFDVNGQTKVVESDKCSAPITITPQQENCPIPGKQNLPKNSPECKEVPVAPPVTPTILPVTGISSVFGIFTATTAAGAMAHRAFQSRRNRG